MQTAMYLVNAVLVEGQFVRRFAHAHGVSKTWLYELLRRYAAEGERGPGRWAGPESALFSCQPAKLWVVSAPAAPLER